MPDLQDKLDLYLALLRKWQGSINLVGNNTLDEARTRHFEDSLQLAEYIPLSMPSSRRKPGSHCLTETDPGFRRDDKVGLDDRIKLFDLGSGAGFPGLVLAMARPDLDVSLIESDTKKCTFLSTVSRETQTPVTIVNQRIESVSRETIPAIVTARALVPLDKLLGYCLPWAEANRGLEMLFLKGENMAAEIEEAQKQYDFASIPHSSLTGGGSVLHVTSLKAH